MFTQFYVLAMRKLLEIYPTFPMIWLIPSASLSLFKHTGKEIIYYSSPTARVSAKSNPGKFKLPSKFEFLYMYLSMDTNLPPPPPPLPKKNQIVQGPMKSSPSCFLLNKSKEELCSFTSLASVNKFCYINPTTVLT